MKEKIKRFVNEHRTLIVVIITVIFAFFLYRYLCCKNRPVKKFEGGANFKYFPLNKINGNITNTNYHNANHKVKGGGPIYKILPFKFNGKIYYFWVLGKEIKDQTMYVLNENGEKLAKDINERIFKNFDMYNDKITIVLKDDNQISRIEKLLTNPLFFYEYNQYNVKDYLGIID